MNFLNAKFIQQRDMKFILTLSAALLAPAQMLRAQSSSLLPESFPHHAKQTTPAF